MIRRSLALAVLATLALGACRKDQDATTTPAAEAPVAAAPAAETPAAAPVATPEAPAAVPAVAATGESLGIPECDDYLTKYQACVSDKVPEASRAALEQSLQMTRDGWKQAIAAGGKDQLAAACTTMREQSRASMTAYGCTDF